MTSFTEQLNGLTIPTANATFEPPKIWFHNGNKTAKTPGVFYARGTDFPDGIPGFEENERFDNEAGLVAAKLNIAVLTWRSQPFIKTKVDGKDHFEYVLKYERDAGMSILTEALCLVEGMDEPVVWSMKGMTGQAVTGRGGIFRSYQDGLLKQAMRSAKRALPFWSFWLPIASARTAEGKLFYAETKFDSFVTPPAVFFPADAMDTLFVGGDVLQRGADVLQQYSTWRETKRMPRDTTEGEYYVEEQKALPAPRNVPQAYEPEDDSEL